MSPAPKLKTNDIIEKLNSLDFGSPGIELALARHKRDANKIRETNPADAYDILGAIACLELDLENVRRYHINAVNLSLRDTRRVFNYSTSLARLGLLDESICLCEEAFENSKNPEFLASLAGRLYFSGDIIGAWKRIKQYNKLCDSKHDLTDEIEKIITSISEKSKFYTEVHSLITRIYRHISSKGVIGYAVIARISEEEHGFYLHYAIGLPTDNILASEITAEIEEMLNKIEISHETKSILCVSIVDKELTELLACVDKHLENNSQSTLRSPDLSEYESIMSLVKDIEID